MGVTGLWRLLEPSGKPIPVETLENKVLAVDISIWLHQVIKGYQDPRGGSVVNAHLLGLFQRLCKLLYYRIKPVFVFDGGVPVLKMQTISKRQSKKNEMHNAVDKMRKQLLEIITKQMAVSTVISDKSPKKSSGGKLHTGPEHDDSLFKLPPVEDAPAHQPTGQSDESDSDDSQPTKHHHMDLHNLDVNSEYYKNLTPREKYDLLTELKETRKQSSWGRLHEIPKKSDNFSDYQMQRLLKRRQVQVSLEETEKEMGGHYLSLNELEILLNQEGIDTKIESIPTRQIASNENAHFVLIKDVKEAIETATKREAQNKPDEKNLSESGLGTEYDEELQDAIKLSLECVDQPPASSKDGKGSCDYSDFCIESSGSEWETDSECDSEDSAQDNLAIVKAYMLENSGFTQHEIKRIITGNRKESKAIEKQSRNDVQLGKNEPSKLLNNVTTVEPNTSSNCQGLVTIHDNAPFVPKADFPDSQCKENATFEDHEAQDPNMTNQNNSKVQLVGIETHTSEVTSQDSKQEKYEELEDHILQHNAVSTSVADKTMNTDSQMKVESKRGNKINTSPESDDDGSPGDALHVESDKSEEVVECIESDSDESFEEVEGGVKIDVNIQNPPEDDIFADVFNSQNDRLKLSSNDEKKPHVAIEEKTEDKHFPKVLEEDGTKCDDTIQEKYKDTDKNDILHEESNHATDDNVLSLKNGSEIAINASPSTSSDVNELSPKKGMTLNEVRALTSQGSEEITRKSQVESIKDQPISTTELMEIADDLEKQKEILQKDQNKLDRMGRNISDEMTKDAQHLLELFGIPYIVAPMEAEAQCAFLETINLTDGTITDDSDIWLFGGKSVYKNFFNQQKYVLQFLSENINNCFKLSREHLILLALLVGSDYTSGLSGVGPVTAMEILSTFPFTSSDVHPPYTSLLQGLKKFKCWWSDSRAYGYGKLRSKLKNISVSQDFPNYKVVEAYLSPQVDSSNEAFTWGRPDVTALRDYAKQKFGWSQTKTDEMLQPVLKRLDQKVSQQSIRSFFRTEIKDTAAVENMSKRVRKAVENMGCQGELSDTQTAEKSKNVKTKTTKTKVNKKNQSNESTKESKLDSDNQTSQKRKKNQSASSNKKPKPCSSENPGKASSSSCDNKSTSLQSGKQVKNQSEFARPFIPSLETIPQRELDKTAMLKNKLKAIEIFRVSKKGPGYVEKQSKTRRAPKQDAGLSESDSE